MSVNIQTIFLAQHPGNLTLYRLVFGDSFGTVSLYSMSKQIVIQNQSLEPKPKLEAEMIGENVRLIVNGLQLTGTKLNPSNKRLLALYGADTTAAQDVTTSIP